MPPPPPPPDQPVQESLEPGEIVERTESSHQSRSYEYDPHYGQRGHSGRQSLMSDWGIDNSDYDGYSYKERQRTDHYQQEYFTGSRAGYMNFQDQGYSQHQANRRYQDRQEDREENWMEKSLIAWQDLISNKEYYLRKDINKEVGCVESPKDLGTIFNDPILNTKIADPQSGEERDLFTCDLSAGTAQFSCSACQITVQGIRVLQSHINGKKHAKNISGYKIIGE